MNKGKSNIIAKAVESQDEVKETLYVSNSCITRYWIWNEEHNCISYGKMDSILDKKEKQ